VSNILRWLEGGEGGGQERQKVAVGNNCIRSGVRVLPLGQGGRLSGKRVCKATNLNTEVNMQFLPRGIQWG
jgi:hypothetical protein